MGDTSTILAGKRVFSGTAFVIALMKFYSDRPLLPWQRKLGDYNKIRHNSACIGNAASIAASSTGFRQWPIPMRYSTSPLLPW